MFQMSKEMFDQCWPAIAAQIEAEKFAERARGECAPAPSQTTAAEAGYVLGVAVGFALQVDVATGTPINIAVPGWGADASSNMDWPHVMLPATTQSVYNRPA